MSTSTLLLPNTAAAAPLRKRFTSDEVDRLTELGFFDGRRYELIDGDLIDKMGQNPPHASAIRLALAWLASIFPPNRIQVQLPIKLSSHDGERNLPEPDLAVLAEDKPEFAKRHPRSEELLLAIEVADTSVVFDLSRKAVLYGAAGVPEYWVLDLTRRMLLVHRQPFHAGYRLTQLFSENDMASLENRTESVQVGELLPAK